MATTSQGTILATAIMPVGSILSTDAPTGSTTITVDDSADFDEAGGTLVINGVTAAYVAVDTDADVITLATATTVAASSGDQVTLWDTSRNVACSEFVAQVTVPGAESNSDPVVAVISHALSALIPEGIRGGTGESVQMELDGGTWYVTGILGLHPLLNAAVIDPTTQVPAAVVGPIGSILNSNPYFTGGDPSGWAWSGGTFTVTDQGPAASPFTYSGMFTQSAANGYAYQRVTLTGANAYQVLVTGWVYSDATTVTVNLVPFIGGTQQTAIVDAITIPADTWTQVSYVATMPSGATSCNAGVGLASAATTGTVYIQGMLVLPQVPGALLQAGTVTANQIAAHTITAAQIAATTITAAQIAANTITAAQILAGSLTASVIGSLGLCLNANPFFAGASIAGWTNTGGTLGIQASPPANPPYPNVALFVSSASGQVAEGFNDKFPVTPGKTYVITCWVNIAGSSAQSFQLGMNWTENGTFVTQGVATFSVPQNTWQLFTATFTAPTSGVNGGYVRIGAQFSGQSISFTGFQCFPQVQGIVDATTITGAQLIGTGAGNEVLIYTGTPVTGNMYGSISATNGADSHSNTVHDGFVSYSPGAATTGFAQLAVNQTSNIPYLVLFANGVTSNHLSFPFQVFSVTNNSGAVNEQYQAQIWGPVNSQQTDQAYIQFFSSSSDKTLDAGGRLYYADANGGQNANLNWDFSGTTLYVAKSITAVKPGTGTSPTNPAQVEAWNVVGGTSQPAFGSGFGAGTGTPRFRLEPLGGGLVRLDGTMATTAATAAGATMFTLPVGYRPTAAKRFVGVSSASGLTGNSPGATSVQITTAGLVQCVQAASASGQQIVLDGIVFPVD